MGFNDKFALQKILNGPSPFWSWLFSNSGRALALPATAVLEISALYGRQLQAAGPREPEPSNARLGRVPSKHHQHYHSLFRLYDSVFSESGACERTPRPQISGIRVDCN